MKVIFRILVYLVFVVVMVAIFTSSCYLIGGIATKPWQTSFATKISVGATVFTTGFLVILYLIEFLGYAQKRYNLAVKVRTWLSGK